MSNPREDQILFFIGWMADSFARVEARVVDCLAILVNSRNLRVGEIISDRLSLNQTVELIGALLENQGNEVSQRAFLSLSKDIRKAAAARNDIMHSSWSTPSADDDTHWDILQERARKRHMTPGGHALDDLLSKMHETTFFIQEVESNIFEFQRCYLGLSLT